MDEDCSSCNILELVLQLRQEKLLISSEKNEIKDLHEKVNFLINSVGKVFICDDFQLRFSIEKLSQEIWISTHQRLNLNSLLLPRSDCSPGYCAHQACSLPNTIFVHAKDVLPYQVSFFFLIHCLKH